MERSPGSGDKAPHPACVAFALGAYAASPREWLRTAPGHIIGVDRRQDHPAIDDIHQCTAGDARGDDSRRVRSAAMDSMRIPTPMISIAKVRPKMADSAKWVIAPTVTCPPLTGIALITAARADGIIPASVHRRQHPTELVCHRGRDVAAGDARSELWHRRRRQVDPHQPHQREQYPRWGRDRLYEGGDPEVQWAGVRCRCCPSRRSSRRSSGRSSPLRRESPVVRRCKCDDVLPLEPRA